MDFDQYIQIRVSSPWNSLLLLYSFLGGVIKHLINHLWILPKYILHQMATLKLFLCLHENDHINSSLMNYCNNVSTGLCLDFYSGPIQASTTVLKNIAFLWSKSLISSLSPRLLRFCSLIFLIGLLTSTQPIFSGHIPCTLPFNHTEYMLVTSFILGALSS